MNILLSYAPNAPLRIRRCLWIPALIVGLIFGIAFTRSQWSEAYARGKEAYLLHQCLRHTLPPDLVVYTSNPVEAATLIASSGNYQPHYDGAAYNVPEWAELTRFRTKGGGLFLHGRKTSQVRVLLAVEVQGYVLVGPPENHDRRTYIIRTETPGGVAIRSAPDFLSFSPKGWPGIQREVYDQPAYSSSHSRYRGLLVTIPIDSTLRFFAGQPDRADASHFTIRYEIDGIPGIIDGWLLDDLDVKMQVRDAPATARVP